MISKYNKVLFVLVLTVLVLTGLWAIDIGASALISDSYVEGLFGVRNAVTQYHFGLVLSFMGFFILCCMYLYEILKNKEKENDRKS